MISLALNSVALVGYLPMASFHASATVHTCRPGTHTTGICVVKLMSDGRLELQS